MSVVEQTYNYLTLVTGRLHTVTDFKGREIDEADGIEEGDLLELEGDKIKKHTGNGDAVYGVALSNAKDDEFIRAAIFGEFNIHSIKIKAKTAEQVETFITTNLEALRKSGLFFQKSIKTGDSNL